MRRSLRTFLGIASAAFFLATSGFGAGLEVSKSNPALLRALKSGDATFRVFVGLADSAAPSAMLRVQPDAAAEPARRAQRLEAQQRLVSQMAPDQFWSAHAYENFSILAGVASADGIRSLAARADVEWIALDAERRLYKTSDSGTQAPLALIHSDSANALGFTGKGQTVAIVDTGIDQSVAGLGGGGFPNAKVIGGTNIAEPGSAPTDCEGHGTSVASIVASPTGVAPDAKLVAIKVFPACQDFTFDSMILTGLDFAISNQAKFGINAINLSLGESATGDNSDLGFCDGLQPQFASPVATALATGMIVTVAAGNEATANQTSSPACLSSVVSVGAVYSTAAQNVDWGICTDALVQPGMPACFSDSNSSLTLLAPGTFWAEPTAGGEVESFSGTSAAAPAAAGAAAVVRSARPGLSPSATVSLLQATGRPILDARNGVVTPLIDVLAAVQFAPNAFGNFDAAPVAIPDPGTATASVTVSGFTGHLSQVEAWVEIDHPDPSQLRLTLTGPDGTSVILQDQTGTPQHPINAIFGRTESSLFSLSAFQGTTANGTWTLTVTDLVPGASGRILHFSINLISAPQVPPTEAIPLFVNGRVLPVVARVNGTKFFQTDVRLLNPNTFDKEFDLYFVGTGMDGSNALKTTRMVGPGQILALSDVVLSEFGLSDSFGQLTIASDDPSGFLVASRTSTHSADGSFGFGASGPRTAGDLALGGGTATTNGLGKGPTFHFNGLGQEPTSHTNVGFTETSGFPVTVRMDVRDGNGTLLGTTSRSTPPYTTFLITDIMLDRGIPSQANIRVDFTVVSPTGRIVPFATTVDNITGDASYHAALMPPLTTDATIVSQVSHVVGANNNFFKSTLDITNMDSKSALFSLTLLPLVIPSDAMMTRVYAISPGQTLEFPDVLSTEFDLDAPAAAALKIVPFGSARLAVSSSTSIEQFGGLVGYTVDGVLSRSGISLGSAPMTTLFLDQSSAPGGFRTNFGFAEVDGFDTTVQVAAYSGDTGDLLATKTYALPALTSVQASATDLLGADIPASNFYLMFSVLGPGTVIPYGASIDNTSGDVTFIPAQ